VGPTKSARARTSSRSPPFRSRRRDSLRGPFAIRTPLVPRYRPEGRRSSRRGAPADRGHSRSGAPYVRVASLFFIRGTGTGLGSFHLTRRATTPSGLCALPARQGCLGSAGGRGDALRLAIDFKGRDRVAARNGRFGDTSSSGTAQSRTAAGSPNPFADETWGEASSRGPYDDEPDNSAARGTGFRARFAHRGPAPISQPVFVPIGFSFLVWWGWASERVSFFFSFVWTA